MAGTVAAEPPKSSLRPVTRGAAEAAAQGIVSDIVRPPEVPQRPQSYGVTPQVDTPPKRRLLGVFRPKARDREIERQAEARAAARAKGAVCGNVAIQGVSIGPVPGRIGGCGIDQAVRVSSVSGVALSTHAVMDCTTAKALNTWVERGMKPALKAGGGVAQIRVAAHYACRPRNNQSGAKISEHGKGRAIDIAGFTLRNGAKVSVLSDWGGSSYSKALRRMHGAACGPFGTVLGPDANRFHRDHFHFDTARYRSGSYCR
ncbi:extensin family protein [Pseudooceanicola onchidii]|uniref:extensin-like domain-containing protein n=1 Tax=Pseudooceanicola onchidii TaxID=2562279 RepID=UPI0010AAE68E|nr:extensin family protein [Pseudooceanicola onchidii]